MDTPPDAQEALRRPQIHWIAVALFAVPFLILGGLTALTDADDWRDDLQQPDLAGRNRIEVTLMSVELAERRGGLVGFLFGTPRAEAARVTPEISGDLVEIAQVWDEGLREARLLDRLVTRLAAAPEERAPVKQVVADDEDLLAELESTVVGDLSLAELARERGDPERAQELEQALEQRVATLARWSSVLTVLLIVALALGLEFGFEVFLEPSGARLGDALVPPAFELRQGLGVYFLAMLGMIPLGVAMLAVPQLELISLGPMFGWTALLAWALLCDRTHPPHTSFGLEVPRSRWPRLASWTLLLLALSTAWDHLLYFARDLLPEMGWAEGVIEPISLGSPPELLLASLDATLGAGLFEELIFRGILFAALRRKLSFLPAALVSTAVFALLHGYGLSGLLSVGGFAVLACWCYERSRSLWPCILAHALSNGVIVFQELAHRVAAA